MRQPSFGTGRSATMVILVVNVVVFLVQLTFEYYTRFPVQDYFALSFDGLRQGYVWQLLTYQFMHGGFLHLLVNCWVIYAFGRELESTLGRARYLGLYFASGIIGGLLQVLAGAVLGRFFGGAVVGASAGAFGLVAAFATLYPERPLQLLLFFIIPVGMRAKFLLLFSAGIAALGLLFPRIDDNIAHAAHLGGLLTGIGFIRFGMHWDWSRVDPRGWFKRASRGSPPPKQRAARKSIPAAEDLPPGEFVMREVDPILDKISAQGIQSLTERERKILEAARAKMANR
jgi:membrane associated rhomboid family serine protease